MQQDDPEAYRSEVEGQFRSGISTFLDSDVIDDAVDRGVRERTWTPGAAYVAFADPASGSGKDKFTLGIAHRDGERAVLDLLRGWAPPFNPSGVIAEIAVLLRGWGLREVTGDRYAPGFVLEGFRAHGIEYRHSERNRSEIYLYAQGVLNAKQAVLLDIPELLRELRGLERRRGTSGRDRVDHRPGSSDDQANSALGAIALAVRPAFVPHVMRITGF